MSIYRKNTKRYFSILLNISTVFLLHLAFTPLAYTESFNLISNIGESGKATNMQTPFRRFEALIVADFAVIELPTDMETNHFINRNRQDIQRLLNRVFNACILPVLSLGILIYSVRALRRKPVRQECVLAISLGGHAPPQNFI